MARFSKALLKEWLEQRMAAIEKENAWTFDPMDGWSQVNGKGERINRAYGAWRELVRLGEEIEQGIRT